MGLKCCVPGCTNKGRFGFHKFPRDEGNCLKWQLKSRKRNLNTKYLPFSRYRICDKHFKSQDYIHSVGKKRLNKVSVPSVLVPDDESVYEEHNYVYMLDKNECLSKEVSIFMCRQINVYVKNVLFRIILCRPYKEICSKCCPVL